MQSPQSLAIMQPYFLPYLGYFQLMAKVGTFVIYDDVHYINRGWINRNRINMNGVAHTITMPLEHASQNKLICDISISPEPRWRKKMLETIRHAYSRAPEFPRVYPLLESIVNCPSQNLAEFLQHSLRLLRDQLGLQTRLVDSSRCYGNAALAGQARIIDICLREKAHHYVNASGGTALYCRQDFEEKGVSLAFLRPTLPRYDTGATPFVQSLSIVDILMHNKPNTISDFLQAGTLT